MSLGKTKRKNKTKTKPKTKHYYLIKNKYIPDNTVKQMMKKRKMWEEYNLNNPQTNIIDFVFLDQFFSLDKKYWSLKSKINSQLDISGKIRNKIDKFNLVRNIRKLNDPKLNKMLLKQHKVNLLSIYKKEDELEKYKTI